MHKTTRNTGEKAIRYRKIKLIGFGWVEKSIWGVDTVGD